MVKTKILIAIDDPNWASIIVQTVFNLINKNNSEIILLNVLESTIAQEEYFYQHPEAFIKHEARKSNFAYIENFLEKNEFKYQFIFEEGDAAKKILDTAEKLDVDMIVMGSHNKKIFETLFLGSVSYKVSRKCKCSIMIINSKYHVHNLRKKIFNLLLAVDKYPPSEYTAKIIDKLIDIKRAQITIFNVISPLKNFLSQKVNTQQEKNLSEKSKLGSEEILQNIEKILKKKNVPQINTVSLTGDPAELIVDYAETNSIDLIVMSSHSKKDLSKLFLGSTCIKVSESTEVPLLIIKKKQY